MDRPLTLRPARPEDESGIIALSAHIWEGDDYIPKVFADWLADEHGQFTVACLNDTIAGCGKLTRLAAGEWWMEGLRVHPEYRGRGIARRLHHNGVALAEQLAAEEGSILRFSTHRRNEAVHKLAGESGFHKVSAHMGVEVHAGEANGTVLPFVPATQETLPALARRLVASPHFREAGGLFEDSWAWYMLQPRLAALVREERVYFWRPQDRAPLDMAGIVIVGDDNRRTLRLNYLDAPDVLKAVVADLHTLAPRYGHQRMRGMPPAAPAFRDAFAAAGWEIAPEFEMWIYERPLGEAQGEDVRAGA